MSPTWKVIAKDVDLATIQRIGNHQAPPFWAYRCWNGENNAVEYEV